MGNSMAAALILLVCGLAAAAFVWFRLMAPRKLDPSKPQSFPVIARREVQEGKVSDGNVRPTLFLTFAMPRSKDLPCGSHVKISAMIDGEKVERSYTPTRSMATSASCCFESTR